jgi:hypothetical protein
LQAFVLEIDQDVRDVNASRPVADKLRQTLFEPIGLGLHAVHEDAPDFLIIQPAALEDMARRWIIPSLTRIGWWKNLVSLTADRLKAPTAAQSSFRSDRFPQLVNRQGRDNGRHF